MATLDCAAPLDPKLGDHERDWLRVTPAMPALDQKPLTQTEKQGSDAGPLASSIVALIAGPFAKEVGQIWPDQRIAEYLTATDARRHVWHAWLSSECIAFRVSNPIS